MKRLINARIIAVTLAIIASLNVGHTQDRAAQEIEHTIRAYLTAMSEGDGEGLRALLDKHLVAIEATRKSAKIHFIDTARSNDLLPPKGNDDWHKDKLKLTSFKAEVSTTHPSVATASFVLTHPLGDKEVAGYREAVKLNPGVFDEPQRKEAQKIIEDRAIQNAMFAMLARQDGKWKIVCLTVPK